MIAASMSGAALNISALFFTLMALQASSRPAFG
jgi:hypothetical protein